MRIVTCSVTALALAAALSGARDAAAHHSIGGEFETGREVTVEGVVKEFHLINPHSYIVVAVGADGEALRDWTLTYGPATKLIRGAGFTPTTLVPGDVVIASGRPARQGLGLYLSALTKADGTKLLRGLEE